MRVVTFRTAFSLLLGLLFLLPTMAGAQQATPVVPTESPASMPASPSVEAAQESLVAEGATVTLLLNGHPSAAYLPLNGVLTIETSPPGVKVIALNGPNCQFPYESIRDAGYMMSKPGPYQGSLIAADRGNPDTQSPCLDITWDAYGSATPVVMTLNGQTASVVLETGDNLLIETTPYGSMVRAFDGLDCTGDSTVYQAPLAGRLHQVVQRSFQAFDRENPTSVSPCLNASYITYITMTLNGQSGDITISPGQSLTAEVTCHAPNFSAGAPQWVTYFTGPDCAGAPS